MAIRLTGTDASQRARYAALVRPERRRRGWSQEELARTAGVDRTTVSNVERGANAPQPDILRRLLGALGIATDESARHADVEAWGGMIEGLLLALPEEHRARAADDAIAVVAEHVAAHGSSEAPTTVPRIAEWMPGGHDEQTIAAKRGVARRDEPHAD